MLLFDNQTKVSYLIAIKQKCHIFGSESWRSWVCACIHVYVAYTCVYEERWKCAYVHTSHMSVCWPWHIQENGNHSAPFKPISGPAQAYQVELVREEPAQRQTVFWTGSAPPLVATWVNAHTKAIMRFLKTIHNSESTTVNNFITANCIIEAGVAQTERLPCWYYGWRFDRSMASFTVWWSLEQTIAQTIGNTAGDPQHRNSLRTSWPRIINNIHLRQPYI